MLRTLSGTLSRGCAGVQQGFEKIVAMLKHLFVYRKFGFSALASAVEIEHMDTFSGGL